MALKTERQPTLVEMHPSTTTHVPWPCKPQSRSNMHWSHYISSIRGNIFTIESIGTIERHKGTAKESVNEVQFH